MRDPRDQISGWCQQVLSCLCLSEKPLNWWSLVSLCSVLLIVWVLCLRIHCLIWGSGVCLPFESSVVLVLRCLVPREWISEPGRLKSCFRWYLVVPLCILKGRLSSYWPVLAFFFFLNKLSFKTFHVFVCGCVGARDTLVRVCFLFPPCGSQGLNSVCQAWWRALLPDEPLAVMWHAYAKWVG